MQTPAWARKIFSAILSPFSWIKRVYTKTTLLWNLPTIVRPILLNCDGHYLDLSYTLKNLTESEVEATLKYIITYFPNLRSLSLACNNLLTVPQAIEHLTQLTTLDLKHNKLTTAPEFIKNLTQLTILDLEGNQLTALPDTIENSKKLTTLDLRSNQLTALPESFGNLKQLKKLYLSHNKLTTLPESFGNLKLSILFLASNSPLSLPITFFSLPKALHLYIYNDQLTFLPQSFRDTHFNDLTAYFKHLVKLPEMQQVKTLLSFTSVSKQFYHLITGKNVTSLKKTLSQTTLENTIEPASLPSEQHSQDNVVQTQSFFSMLPSEISKIILLQASGLPPSNYGAFTKLICEKPTTKSIECFLDNTTSPSSQRNWRNVVQQDYEAAQERSRT